MEETSIPKEELDRISVLGRSIYRERLAKVLEPEFNGQDVAIHVDTGDYEVGSRPRRLTVTLRKRHPEGGMIMLTNVGPARPTDMLAYRMLFGQLSTGRGK